MLLLREVVRSTTKRNAEERELLLLLLLVLLLLLLSRFRLPSSSKIFYFCVECFSRSQTRFALFSCLLLGRGGGGRERDTERERRPNDKKTMTAPCERCGYAMRLLDASPTIACSSCNKSHSTEKVFNDDAKTTKTSSNAASFLYKFNIEPRNPDGTKIGSERHDDDDVEERERERDARSLTFFTFLAPSW